ncbi:MAG: hypothetical protein ACFFAN_17370 [Promethearchaeota archaeon]
MSYSPPKKGTIILAFLVLLIGIIIGIWELYDGLSTSLNIDSNYLIIAGFILTFFSFLIMYIGVKARGV